MFDFSQMQSQVFVVVVDDLLSSVYQYHFDSNYSELKKVNKIRISSLVILPFYYIKKKKNGLN